MAKSDKVGGGSLELSAQAKARQAALSAPFSSEQVKKKGAEPYVPIEYVMARLHAVFGPRISVTVPGSENGVAQYMVQRLHEGKQHPTGFQYLTEIVLPVRVVIYDEEQEREIVLEGFGSKIYNAFKKDIGEAFRSAKSTGIKNAVKALGIPLDGGSEENEDDGAVDGFAPPPPITGAITPPPPVTTAQPLTAQAQAQVAQVPPAPPTGQEAVAQVPPIAQAPLPPAPDAAPGFAPAPVAPPMTPPPVPQAPQPPQAAQVPPAPMAPPQAPLMPPPAPQAPPQQPVLPPPPAAQWEQPVPPQAPPAQAPVPQAPQQPTMVSNEYQAPPQQPVYPQAIQQPMAPPVPQAPQVMAPPPAPPQAPQVPPSMPPQHPVAPPPAPPQAPQVPAPQAPQAQPQYPQPIIHAHQPGDPINYCTQCQHLITGVTDPEGHYWPAQEVFDTTSNPNKGYGRALCIPCYTSLATSQAQAPQ
jgi:hypothetical protein